MENNNFVLKIDDLLLAYGNFIDFNQSIDGGNTNIVGGSIEGMMETLDINDDNDYKLIDNYLDD